MRATARALALLVAIVLGPTAAAQGSSLPLVGVDVDESAFDHPMARGVPYRPVVIDLESRLDRTERVEITIKDLRNREIHSRSVDLAAGERARIEIAVACHRQPWVQLDIVGLRAGRLDSRGLNPRQINVPWSVRRGGRAAATRSTSALHLRREDARRAPEIEFLQGHEVHELAASRAYRLWQSYLGYDVVALDQRALAEMHADARAALRGWLETGGSIILTGARLDQAAALDPVFPGLVRAASDGEEPATAEVGFGRVVATRADAEVAAREILEVLRGPRGENERLDAIERLDPGSDQSEYLPASYMIAQPAPKLPGLSGIPASSIAILVLLFAVLVGPVNLFVLSRMKRRVWAVFTIPACSLLAFVAIAGYAFVSEGLEVLVRPRTVTILDQRTQRAATVADLGYYTGLSPAGGLRYRGDLAALPSRHNAWDRDLLRGVDQGDGTRLFGDWLPARVPTIIRLFGSGPERGHLEIVEAEGGLAVTNALGVDVRRLVIRAADGRHYRIDDLAAGASGRATPGGDENAARRLVSDDRYREARQVWTAPAWGAFAPLTPREYVATLDRPLVENYGTDRARVLPGLHVLRGRW